MMSFAGRIKSLSILTKHFFKSEALYFGFNSTLTRALVTKRVLFYRNANKIIDMQENRKPFKASENLGEVIDLDVEFDEVKINNLNIKSNRKINKKNVKLNHNAEVNSSFKNIEVNDNIHMPKENNLEKPGKSSVKKYSDEKENSKIFSSTIINLRSNKLRKKKQKIILEGKRLIHDAISAGFSPLKVFFSRISDIETLDLPEKTSLHKVPYKSFSIWSDVVTPQGVMAVFEMPELSKLKNNVNSIPLTIICNNIRDPGNLGSILRIAAGVGCEKLILIKGCTDIWESKVLRAGAGAHFRLPILNNLQWSDVKNEISEDSKIILADLGSHFTVNDASENKDDPQHKQSLFRNKSEISENLPMYCYYSVEYGKESAVIIVGGETHGVSEEAYEFGVERKGIRVFIPMNNEIESLNTSVALGILAYEFKRQFDFIYGKEIPLQK